MNRNVVAVLVALVAGCSGEVQIQSITSTGTAGGGGAGGSGTCAVALSAGCACPDDAAESWVQTFSGASVDDTTAPSGVAALAIAPDGSTAVRLDTFASNGTIATTRLVKLDASGNVAWELSEGRLWSPTPDPRDCSTVVSGVIEGGSTDLLGQTISCSTAYCPFVARLDAVGSLVWVKVYDFGGDAWTSPTIAGVLADGRIALAGPFEGTIDLGNGPLGVPPDAHSGIFVAALSPSGDALWSRHLVREKSFYLLASVVVSPAGDIAVATPLDGGAVDFGEGPMAVPGTYAYGGLALASYDATGALRFGKVIGSAGDSQYPRLARDSAGRLIVAQLAQGAMDFGGGPIGAEPNDYVTAVAAFDAGGQYLWSTAVDADFGCVPAVDTAGHVWVGAGSGAIAELDSVGALVDTHVFAGSGERNAFAIGFAPSGAPIIAGSFEGTLDLGQGILTAHGKRDAFVAALAP